MIMVMMMIQILDPLSKILILMFQNSRFKIFCRGSITLIYQSSRGRGNPPKSNPLVIVKTVNSFIYVQVRLLPNGLWKIFF